MHREQEWSIIVIMKLYKFTAIFVPEKDNPNTFTVYIPALRGCVTFGESIHEARYNMREALELYLETFLEEEKLIPADKKVKIPKGSHAEEITVGVDFEIKTGFAKSPLASYVR